LGRNAAEYTQNYAWEKVTKLIVGVYEELLGIEFIATVNGLRGWRDIARQNSLSPGKEQTGRERVLSQSVYKPPDNFQSVSSFPLDTEVNRWAA
jgi:hypothetical protein